VPLPCRRPPSPRSADKQFQNTGLERTGALEKDLVWFKSKYGIDTPQVRALSLAHGSGYCGTMRNAPKRSSGLDGSLEPLPHPLTLHMHPHRTQLPADSPGLAYAVKLRELAAADPPAFICHYYNYYFAHTAGGRMIGAKVQLLPLCVCVCVL